MTDQSTNQSGADSHPLRTSRYDRVSSWLLSLLVTIGLLVLILLVAWYSYAKDEKKPSPTGEFTLEKLRKIEIPTGDLRLEIPDDESRKAADKAKKNIRRDLTRLDVAAAKAKQLDDQSLANADGIDGFDTDGYRQGTGPSSENFGKPRRWEIRFDKTSLDAYARQLDFFKIELAVLLPDGRVAYAFNLTKSKPDSRFADNPHETEKRYYLTWRKGNLQKADRELLSRAGIDAGGGIILKFLPTEVETQLVALAKSRAGSKAENVERTRFGVRPAENGFAFYVLEQTYNE